MGKKIFQNVRFSGKGRQSLIYECYENLIYCVKLDHALYSINYGINFSSQLSVLVIICSFSSTGLSPCTAHAIDGLDIEEVSCNVLNMEFFDRLWVRGVVRDGEMVKSKKDSWGDIPCCDDVRKVSHFFLVWGGLEQAPFVFMVLSTVV